MNPLYKKIMSDIASAAGAGLGYCSAVEAFAERLRSLADAEGEDEKLEVKPVGMEGLCAQQRCRYCGKTMECECWSFKMPKVKPDMEQEYFLPTYSHGEWCTRKWVWEDNALDNKVFAAGDVFLTRKACEARIEELRKMMLL